MIVNAEKILVVVAHPDDEVLGAGGTIRRVVDAGVTVDLLVATDGSSAQFGDDIGARQRRNTHLDKACDILGINQRAILGFPDMRLDTVPHIELNNAIGRAAEEGSYDTILTHHPGDVNLDHRQVFDSVMVVARPRPGVALRCIATFFVNSSTEWGSIFPHRLFAPNFFVDISGTIETKLTALSAYADELRAWPHPRSSEAVRARAKSTGSEVGVEYAEAFQVVRAVARDSLQTT